NVKDYEGVIDATKTSLKAKQLAVQLIPHFFKFFPNLSSRALNAHFDLIEEEDLAVRVQAIHGPPLFCKDTKEYISKIVDILGQLLTVDEIVERDAIHKAFMSVLRQDVKGNSLTALFKHIWNVEEPSQDDTIRDNVSNADHIDRLILCMFMAILFFVAPNASNSFCGYNIVIGQPSYRLGEDFSEYYKDFTERDLEKIGVGRGWIRGGVSCRFGRGRGHEHERDGPIGKKLFAEDLDANLDKYHLKATRIK
ncbi:hypothetical protein J1N35_038488, partial [Gossypium stocksii]